MRAEHLKVWCKNGSQSWLDFVRVVQECFTTGEIPKAMCFSTLVLIPKADGSLQGIGLLEVAWKVVSGIVQQRLQASIEFEDSLHGFQPKPSVRTAMLVHKLITEWSLHRGQMLFQVFLDLKKAYNTLDQGQTLLILEQYGVGPKVQHLLHNFWQGLEVVP